MSTGEVVVAGRALHSGEPARVTIRRVDAASETTFAGAPLSGWRPLKVARSSAITRAGAVARTVEHLFAALAALGWHRGIAVELEGRELPILDGCAEAWLDALRPISAPSAPPRVRIVREERVEVGASWYRFSPAARARPRVSVELELDDARLEREAAWDGDLEDFAARIAGARTFCFANELDELARAGLASHVTPEMVVVIADEILAAGRPFKPDEPARHKLLDLVGDLFLHGGPPAGHVHGHRPGHWATHEAVRIATERGVFAPA